jgi:hypothetical protein
MAEAMGGVDAMGGSPLGPAPASVPAGEHEHRHEP